MQQHNEENYTKTKTDREWFMTLGQETKRIYSYNRGADKQHTLEGASRESSDTSTSECTE